MLINFCIKGDTSCGESSFNPIPNPHSLKATIRLYLTIAKYLRVMEQFGYSIFRVSKLY